MDRKEKILLDRMIFSAAAVILIIFLAVLYWITAADASMSACLDRVTEDGGDMTCPLAVPVEEPHDAYLVSTLTFGGTCTPASMLGSGSYGTFNLKFSESGAESFFSDVSEYFTADHGTVVGLSAVFSDRTDLVPAEKAVTEWYLAPGRTSEIFSSGGVDALSLECLRSGDYGDVGREDTREALAKTGREWGNNEKNIVFTLDDGVKAAVLCACYMDCPDEEIASRISTAAEEYDIVILYITDRDDSYVVSEYKRASYRAFAEAGADVIIGTNGSKLQCIEEWKGSTIAYSLGSLLDGSTKYPEKYTALIRLVVNIDSGEVTAVKCEPVPLTAYDENRSWHPAPVTDPDEKSAVLDFLSGMRDNPNP